MNNNRNFANSMCSMIQSRKDWSAKMRKGCALSFAMLTVAVVQGADFTFKSGKSDFTKPENYTVDGKQATERPGANDNVIIPAGTYSLPGHSSSFAILSGVKRVKPSDGTIFEITVAESDTRTFNAPINHNGGFAYNNESVRCYGKVVKKGLGTLILAASGKTTSVADNTNFNMDYFTQIDLREGTLKLPQHAVGNMYFGDFTMAEGTTLVTCGNMTDDETKKKAIFTYVRSINGNGIITNETGRSGGQTFSPFPRDEIVENVFRGRICHPAKIWLTGRLTQCGNDTGIEEPIVVEGNRGHLNDGKGYGTYSFDNVGLLGPATDVRLYGLGGGIHYFGLTDAIINKAMNLYSYEHPAFVDAGSHGGLTFSGDWYVAADSANSAVQKWLVLMGSNSVPCVITGDFKDSKFSGNYATDSFRTIFTKKLGTGTWRLAGKRTHGGGFAIEEGTLQFESIAEKGVNSSLGRSTNLTIACSVRNPEQVEYAFSLGSMNANASKAVFDYVGQEDATCTSRPLVLVGGGGCLKASDGRLTFGGVSARDANSSPTLTIDGNGVKNELRNVTDGADGAKVNIVKDGNGEWILSGEQDFSGDLHVKNGTLTINDAKKYTWFRFTVKETGNAGAFLSMRQLALYDAKGVRQNICLSVKAAPVQNSSTTFWPDSNVLDLLPGGFAFGSQSIRFRANPDYYADQLFSDVGNTANSGIKRYDGVVSYGRNFQLNVYNATEDSPMPIQKTDPESWVPFVMRLTNGVPPIVAYDIESYYNNTATNGWPKVAVMEASVDGVNWDLVETNAIGEVVSEHTYDFSIPLGGKSNNANRWYSNGEAQINWSEEKGTTRRPDVGFKIRSRPAVASLPLQNVRSVSVASGATLRTSDTVAELKSLKVDSAGAGTIEGFSFASQGMLDVMYSGSKQGTVVLPGTYLSCSGMENISGWRLKVNGAESNSYRIKARNGRIALVLRGMFITVR